MAQFLVFTNNNVQSKLVRKWLVANGQSYRHCDIEHNLVAKQKLNSFGIDEFPLVIYGQNYLIGFRPARMASLIKEGA